MSESKEIKAYIFVAISELLENKLLTIEDNTPLIGDGSVLDSMKLIELCLTLEDKASELGFALDWTSDAAMSRSRSMFRTAGSLSLEFISQIGIKK